MTRRQLIGRYLLIGYSLAAALAALLWYFAFHSYSAYVLILCWLAGINPVTFFYYGYDKYRARIGSHRVPEAVLHSLSMAGGSPGAYVAMRWYRHKTIKGRFLILFWGVVILQATIVALVLFRT